MKRGHQATVKDSLGRLIIIVNGNEVIHLTEKYENPYTNPLFYNINKSCI